MPDNKKYKNIRALQKFLKDEGYNPGAIDNVWGPKTEAAFKAYTEANPKVLESNVMSGLWDMLPLPARSFIQDFGHAQLNKISPVDLKQDAITEQDLSFDQMDALRGIVRKNLAKGKTNISYGDYGTDSKYGDVGPSASSANIAKQLVFSPEYNLKSTFGQANIVTTPTDTFVVDRYNFNDGQGKSVFNPFAWKDAAYDIGAAPSLYTVPRKLAKHFGSKEGQGAPVLINTSEYKNGGQVMKKYQNGGYRDPKDKTYLESTRDRVIGNPIIPGMNFQSDNTRMQSPLLDERYLAESLRTLPGREVPFSYEDAVGRGYFLDPYRREIMNSQPTPVRGLNLDTREGKAAAGYEDGGFLNIGKDLWKKFGNQVSTGLAGVVDGFTGGILPMDKVVSGSNMREYGDAFNMGNKFGTAASIVTGGGGLFGKGKNAANAANTSSTITNTTSTLNGANFNDLKNLINGGNGQITDFMSFMSNGINSSQNSFSKGGVKDVGQDANVESGEIMFSENGGQFNSMNPNAPIDEIAPGVSLVKGNVDNDNVPVQLPGGDKTYILSKKLGYADEALEVVKKYKELHDLPDSNDYIENQTRKLNMNKLKSQLKAIFDKQEASKPKQANRGGIPQANLGDVIGKGINALDKFGKTGTGQFLTNNLDSIYNLGMAAFAKDPELIDAADYQTEYVPQEYQMDVSALMSPYKDAMASARYGIGQSGGSAAEIIAGNAAMASRVAPAMASQIGQMHAEKSRFDAEQYANQFKADQANRSIAYDIDRANEERLAQRQQFLKEGISGVQDYFQRKRQENFMKDHAGFGMYNSAGQLNAPIGSLIGGNFGIGSTSGEEDYNWLQGVQLPGNFE